MPKNFICPLSFAWNSIYKILCDACQKIPGIPKPPVPLVLDGWHLSSDLLKQLRWQETLIWAAQHGLEHLIPEFTPDQIYIVRKVLLDV